MSETEIQNHDEVIKFYELGFNLVSSLPEAELDKEFINLKEIITKNGKEIVSESNPTLIDLAYTISKNVESKKQKHDTAYFGWVKFKAEAESLVKMKEELDLLPSMLRYLLINATEEGDISSEDVANAIKSNNEKEEPRDNRRGRKEEPKVEKKEEVVAPVVEENKVNEKEVDQAIEDLVKE
ncbi:MAG: ribosomal protein S6 [Candidatus Paceibacteria bacterium]|jgi:ribosomal protein S6